MPTTARWKLPALACLLSGLLAAGCGGNPDGPVRPAGSIDIPESALNNRPGSDRINKLQAKIAKPPGATPAAH